MTEESNYGRKVYCGGNHTQEAAAFPGGGMHIPTRLISTLLILVPEGGSYNSKNSQQT